MSSVVDIFLLALLETATIMCGSGRNDWPLTLNAANLIHQDSRGVIKVVLYGINLACFPDEKTFQLVELHIAKQQEQI
jgi:hypothetical protein